MGRSIPSFRQLIEIERLNWSEFKKELSTKNEKEAFNIIFENAKLYTQYLSNANRPIPIEPIMMGALFHNYKTLLKLNSEDNVKRRINRAESSSIGKRETHMPNHCLIKLVKGGAVCYTPFIKMIENNY